MQRYRRSPTLCELYVPSLPLGFLHRLTSRKAKHRFTQDKRTQRCPEYSVLPEPTRVNPGPYWVSPAYSTENDSEAAGCCV